MAQANPNKFKDFYAKYKEDLLNNRNICHENIQLFKEFFDRQEYKLKRIRGLRRLDESNYKTLVGYVSKFKKVNEWFKNKAWVRLTKEDIKQVYDDLEDGKIKRENGTPYENLDDSYYSKVFKSLPFELAGKKDIAKQVISFRTTKKKEVRFILEDDFRKIVNNAYTPINRLLLWLAFDIGENINALLQLKKIDFYKENNPHTNEPEFRVNLKEEILKRSRKPRSEITNYSETFQLLEQILPTLKDNELVFKFAYGYSKNIIDRAVERAEVRCIPNNEKVTWKDLRSGMACDLLKKGWSTDEVNARLGHSPSSDEIDKYINFLAIDRHTPKKKVQEFTVNKLKGEIEQSKERERLQALRLENVQKQMLAQQEQILNMKETIMRDLAEDIQKKIKEVKNGYISTVTKSCLPF
jgi:integrase